MKTITIPLHLPAAKIEPFIIGLLEDREVVSVKVDRENMTILHNRRPRDNILTV
jgi:hypothetical protein